MTNHVRRRAAAHVLVDDVDLPALDDRDAHHVFRVLRVRDGESVTVTDGRGGWRECVASDGALESVGDAQFEPARVDPFTVAWAIPKQDRPEWIVQKLTELGVDRIVMLHADRSVVRWNAERAAKNLVKLRRVAAEALQQSRGVWLPGIEGPLSSHDVLPTAYAAEPGGDQPGSRAVRAIAVGPEGGWSDAELSVAAGSISLGSRVLRVETAAIVAGVWLTGDGE